MYGYVNAYSSISYTINGLTFTLLYYLVTVLLNKFDTCTS